MFDRHQILRRLKLNLGAHALGYGAAIVHQLFLLPVFLQYWPKEIYGEWLVLTAVALYITLSDFGMETVGGNRMNMAVARGDYKTANEFLHTMFVYQSTVLSVLFLIATALTVFGNFPYWLKIEHIPAKDVNIILIAAIARAFLSCQLGIFRAIYCSNFMAARGVFISNASRILDIVVTIPVVMTGGGVVRLSLALLATLVATVIAMQVDVMRTCPQFSIGRRYFSMEKLRLMLREGTAYQLLPGGAVIVQQGMTLVVNYLLGPAAVVTYSVARAVCRSSLLGVQMIGWTASVEMSILYGRGEMAKVAKLFRNMVRLSCWLGLLVAMGCLMFGGLVVTLLTHGKVHISESLWMVFAAGAVTTSFWNSADVLMISINKHIGLAKRAFTFSVLIIPVGAALIHFFGLYGAALATVVLDLAIAPYVWRSCKKILQGQPDIDLSMLVRIPDFGKVKRFLEEAILKRKQSEPEAGPVQQPLVSILISNYNYVRYVGGAIESALNQTYRNIEVILVDDGSTDNSRDVIESFHDPRFRAIYQSNKGQGAAINAAFNASRGEIIVILDADDRLFPKAVETIASRQADGAGLYCSRLRVELAEGEFLSIHPEEPFQWTVHRCDGEFLRYGYYVTLPTGKAFSRESMAQVMPIPEEEFRTAADAYLQDCIVFHGSVVFIDEPLGIWRHHGKNDHQRLDLSCDFQALKALWDLDCRRQRAVAEHAGRLGITVPDDLMFRRLVTMRYRAMLWKLYPPEQRQRRESLAIVLGSSLQTIWLQMKASFSKRILATCWLVGVIGCPAEKLPALLTYFSSSKKAMFHKKMMGK